MGEAGQCKAAVMMFDSAYALITIAFVLAFAMLWMEVHK